MGPESEEKDRERASRAAQQVRRAAALTAELAVQSESKVFDVCSHPPGLSDEPQVAARSHLVNDSPPCSPPPVDVREIPASTLPVNNKPLQEARVSHLAGSFRAPRPRSSTRAQDNAAVLEETLRLFVEATGKDDASMRQQLVNSGEHAWRRSNASKPRRRKRGSSSEGCRASNPKDKKNSMKNSGGG